MKKAWAVVSFVLMLGVVARGVTIDGSVSGGEGWIHLTEDPHAQPVLGGNPGSSDSVGESSTFNWWDAGAGVNRAFGDNRGDVMNFYLAHDINYLYIAVTGPTAPFNAFDDAGGAGPEWDNDVGDLYIAIDAGLGSPSGSLNVLATHNTFGGVRAVDFLGWTPTHFIGVQYVDNGGGGGGYANLEQAGTHAVIAGGGHGVDHSGFLWSASINASAGYDSFNGIAGEFEFRIPWAMLGLALGGPAPGEPLRFAMYVAQNFAQYDLYDSGPGIGNGTHHEQIGDNPGDPDGPGAGLLGPTDPGSFGQPGANHVADLSLSPGHLDGVDTIEEYYSYVVNAVPEPGTYALLGLGLLAAAAARRRLRA